MTLFLLEGAPEVGFMEDDVEAAKAIDDAEGSISGSPDMALALGGCGSGLRTSCYGRRL